MSNRIYGKINGQKLKNVKMLKKFLMFLINYVKVSFFLIKKILGIDLFNLIF